MIYGYVLLLCVVPAIRSMFYLMTACQCAVWMYRAVPLSVHDTEGRSWSECVDNCTTAYPGRADFTGAYFRLTAAPQLFIVHALLERTHY